VTHSNRVITRSLIAAIISIAAVGCRSGTGWNPFARGSSPPIQAATQSPPGANSQQPSPADQPPANASSVMPASYQKPQYVPTTGLTPSDLIKNENLEEVTGQKKT
jgi:hypothetical protein